MKIYGESTDLEALVQELGQLFNSPKSIQPQSIPAKTKFNSEGYQAPIKGTFYNSGGFSLSSPNPRHPQGHLGVDMRAPAGTPVYPLAPGVVTHVGVNPKGGNAINIQHADNVRTYYAHLSSVKVHKGDKVDNNTIIGSVGNTGNASVTWPHLHFQVWKDGQIQDPAHYFTIPKYTNVDKNKEQWWASEEAKNEANSFNMKNHLESGKTAFTNNVNKLYKIADTYYKLIKALQ